jgi:hypothetical protein
VTIVGGVGTLDVAELALIAGIDDELGFLRGEGADVAIMAIDGVEELGKGGAEIEAEPAAMTDLEDALEFLGQGGLVPVERVVRIVGQTRCGLVFDAIHLIQALCLLLIGES